MAASHWAAVACGEISNLHRADALPLCLTGERLDEAYKRRIAVVAVNLRPRDLVVAALERKNIRINDAAVAVGAHHLGEGRGGKQRCRRCDEERFSP